MNEINQGDQGYTHRFKPDRSCRPAGVVYNWFGLVCIYEGDILDLRVKVCQVDYVHLEADLGYI